MIPQNYNRSKNVAMEHNGLQLYAVVCRLLALEKLRIGAVTCWCG